MSASSRLPVNKVKVHAPLGMGSSTAPQQQPLAGAFPSPFIPPPIRRLGHGPLRAHHLALAQAYARKRQRRKARQEVARK